MAAAARALLLPVFGVVAAPPYDLICMVEKRVPVATTKKLDGKEYGVKH